MGVGAPVEDMMMPAGFSGRGMSLHNGGQSRIEAQALSRGEIQQDLPQKIIRNRRGGVEKKMDREGGAMFRVLGND